MKKIPDHATRVFKGVFHDVYQWPQEMFDGSTATFEAMHRHTAVEVIAIDGDKLYIAEQEQPLKPKYLSLFGGQIEDGEDPLAAAKRELLEESGFESDDWSLLSVEQFPWNKLDWEIHIFVAKNVRKVAEQALDGGEKISVKQLSFDEFLDIAGDTLHWARPAWLFKRIVAKDGTDRLRELLK